MPTTTTNFAWTIPSDTDLVKDGASAIRTIGNAVDASFASVTLRAVTTTSDTFVLADLRNKLVTYSNAAAIAARTAKLSAGFWWQHAVFYSGIQFS